MIRELVPGAHQRPVTLTDVAALAKVSSSVASRVLTNDKEARVNAQTRERVLNAATRLGYVPDHRARALRVRRAGAVALVVPDIGNAVFSELYRGVHHSAEQRDSTVLLGQLNASGESRAELERIVGRGRVDGVILQRSELMPDSRLDETINIQLPVVLFNSVTARHRGSVIFHDEAAARIATQHLLDLGHRRIGWIGGTTTHDAARRRENGFRATMRDARIRIDKDWVTASGWEASAGESGLAAVLAAKRRPTAVVVASVNAAVGALGAAARSGVTVPSELSIVTIQDTWIAEVANPSITAVRLPLRQAGEAATNMLLAHLEGEPLDDIVVSDPPPHLVVRQSTSALV